jgi:hypothetical protein
MLDNMDRVVDVTAAIMVPVPDLAAVERIETVKHGGLVHDPMLVDGQVAVMDRVAVQDHAVTVDHAGSRDHVGVMHDPLVPDHTGAFYDFAGRQPASAGAAVAPAAFRVGCGWRGDEHEREHAQHQG